MRVSPVREGIPPLWHHCVVKHTLGSVVEGDGGHYNRVTGPQNTHSRKQEGAEHLQGERERDGSTVTSHSYWQSIRS